jgi:hypothetical protein
MERRNKKNCKKFNVTAKPGFGSGSGSSFIFGSPDPNLHLGTMPDSVSKHYTEKKFRFRYDSISIFLQQNMQSDRGNI